MAESLVQLIAREADVRQRIKDHEEAAKKERIQLDAALNAVRHSIGCAKAGLDLTRIDRALSILKLGGSYVNGGVDRGSVIRDAVDWLATGKCAAYRGLDGADFGTKNYDRWRGQRSDHEWGGPSHGSICFQIGLKDRQRALSEDERADAIYFLLNIESWEHARRTGARMSTARNFAVATTPHRPRAAPLSARIAGATPGLAEVASEPGKTPDRLQLTAREYKLIRDVRTFNDATSELLQAVIRSGGKWSTNALRANLAAVRAAQAIWADGLEEEADNTAADLPGYQPRETL